MILRQCPFIILFFFTGLCFSALMRTCTVLHRNTIGKNSNIIFSKTNSLISMKFGVNVPQVVPFHNTVFYRFISIGALMRTRTVLHVNTIGKNSKIFFSETTGPISMKFDVNVPQVVPFHNTVFYGFMSIGALMRTHTV